METMHAAGRRSLPPVPRATTERPAPPADRPEPDDRDAESPTERFVVDLATGEQRSVSTVDAPEDDAPEDDAAEMDAPIAIAADADADAADPIGEASEDASPQDAPENASPEDAPEDAPADDAPEVAPEDDASQGDQADAEPDAQVAVEPDAAEPAAEAVPRPEDADLDPAQEYVVRLRAAAADFAEAAGAESAVVREAVPPARHRRARCRLVLRYADDSEIDVTFVGPAGRPGTPSRHSFDRQIRRWLADGQHREDAWLVDDEEASDGLAVDLSAWVAAA